MHSVAHGIMPWVNIFPRYRHVLSIPEGKAALQQLPEHLKELLSTFNEKPLSHEQRKDAGGPQWALDNPLIWALDSQSYESWLCRLVYALLLQVQHPVLAAVKGVARLRASLAEVIVPYVLADLAATAGHVFVNQRLSKQVSSLNAGLDSAR